MEMRMLLCWVLRRFRFSEAPGVSLEEWEGGILDWLFVVHQGPLLVTVSFRSEPSKYSYTELLTMPSTTVD
jgi:hypothetical protein